MWFNEKQNFGRNVGTIFNSAEIFEKNNLTSSLIAFATVLKAIELRLTIFNNSLSPNSNYVNLRLKSKTYLVTRNGKIQIDNKIYKFVGVKMKVCPVYLQLEFNKGGKARSLESEL